MAHVVMDSDVLAGAYAPDERLYNDDLAPVPRAKRNWRVGSFAALWISMSACIPTYMLASSLVFSGCKSSGQAAGDQNQATQTPSQEAADGGLAPTDGGLAPDDQNGGQAPAAAPAGRLPMRQPKPG